MCLRKLCWVTDSCLVRVRSVCVLLCLCVRAQLLVCFEAVRLNAQAQWSRKAENSQQRTELSDSGIFFCSFVLCSAPLVLLLLSAMFWPRLGMESLEFHCRGCASVCVCVCVFLYICMNQRACVPNGGDDISTCYVGLPWGDEDRGSEHPQLKDMMISKKGLFVSAHVFFVWKVVP